MRRIEEHRILIADSSAYLQKLLAIPKPGYLIELAHDGEECLRKIESFKPDLILLQLLLPKIHGIEILSSIRKKGLKVGVIVAADKSAIQDYKASLEAGANYFLIKPFTADEFFELAARFFAGKLHMDEYHPKMESTTLDHCYFPSYEARNYLKFWGTRGSITVSGSDFSRFGGNTSCAEIRFQDELVLLDAGTGIRALSLSHIGPHIKKIHLFLSHTHWDHIIGLPFFEPLYHPNYQIIIYGPVNFGRSVEELVNNMLAYEFFPVRLDEFQANIVFKEIRDQTPIQIGPLLLNFHYTTHPGVTYAFKISTPNKTIGYATDNEILVGYHGHPQEIDETSLLLEPHLSLIRFFTGCDLLIHEAQYTPKEYIHKVGWGHSSVPNAALLCKYAKIKHWLVTHHDPSHTDHFLMDKLRLHRRVIEDCGFSCEVNMAFDGMTLSL